MPGKEKDLAAAHFYYLLKSDEEDLQKLWSALTGSSGRQASPGLAFPEEKDTGACRIVHRVQTGDACVCLIALPDLSVVEVGYPAAGGTLAEQWRQASEAIEAGRRRLLEEVGGVFGETTLLVAPEGTGPEEMIEAAGYATLILMARLNPDAGAAQPVLLLHFPEQSENGRDFYAVTAADVAAFIDCAFPGMDSQIKKLMRTAS